MELNEKSTVKCVILAPTTMNPAEVIFYADKANARMRSKYYRLIRNNPLV